MKILFIYKSLPSQPILSLSLSLTHKKYFNISPIFGLEERKRKGKRSLEYIFLFFSLYFKHFMKEKRVPPPPPKKKKDIINSKFNSNIKSSPKFIIISLIDLLQ